MLEPPELLELLDELVKVPLKPPTETVLPEATVVPSEAMGTINVPLPLESIEIEPTAVPLIVTV